MTGFMFVVLNSVAAAVNVGFFVANGSPVSAGVAVFNGLTAIHCSVWAAKS